MFEMQLDIRARSRTDPRTGRRSAARSRIIATAIKSSNRVNPRCFLNIDRPSLHIPDASFMAASGNMEIIDHSICSQVLADLRYKAAKYYAPIYSTKK
jgi:hypothetical protein